MIDSIYKKGFKLLVIWIGGWVISAVVALLMLFILNDIPKSADKYTFLVFTLFFAVISGVLAYFWIKETRNGKILYAIISAALFIAPKIGLLTFGLA